MPTVVGGLLHEGSVYSRVSGDTVVIEQEKHYRVQADTVGQARTELLAATGLPVSKVTVDLATGMTCRDVRLEPEKENRLYFRAITQWSSEVKEDNDQSTPKTGDPTEWIPQAEVEFEPVQEVVKKDLDSKPYLNSAGDPFENGLIVQKRIPSRVFVQFEPVGPYAPNWTASTAYRKGQYVTKGSNIYQATVAGTSASSGGPTGTGSSITDGTVTWKYQAPPASGAVNIDQIEARCDTINSTPFLGRAANTLLLEVRKAAIGRYNGYRCWRIEYAIKYKKDNWLHKQWSIGYAYKDISGAKQAYKIGTAVMLAKLDSSGNLVSNQLTDDPALLTFRNYEQLDFNTFLKVV